MDTRDGPNSENAVAERLLDGPALCRTWRPRGCGDRFARAVLTCPTLVALNKLALVHLEHRHGPEEALGIVAPNLGDSPPSRTRMLWRRAATRGSPTSRARGNPSSARLPGSRRALLRVLL